MGKSFELEANPASHPASRNKSADEQQPIIEETRLFLGILTRRQEEGGIFAIQVSEKALAVVGEVRQQNLLRRPIRRPRRGKGPQKRKEYSILAVLANAEGEVLSERQICLVTGYNDIEEAICSLRAHILNGTNYKIERVRGPGLKLVGVGEDVI